MGYSVTKRIDAINQPRGGYISPKEFIKIPIETCNALKEENISASLIGLAVDYLTRYMLSKDLETSFSISLKGSLLVGEYDNALGLLHKISGMDDVSIANACKLVGYDVCYRAGTRYFKPVCEISPDSDTIYNVREMVGRSLQFFDKYGPVVKEGFDFKGGYTDVVTQGDGDFLTHDTLWDFKVSKTIPNNKNTLQLLVYYLMGMHSVHNEFKSVKYLGIFNPRLNTIYKYDLDRLSSDTIEKVEKDVIGY